MKLAGWKRAVLGTMLALSLAGGALATTTTADAARGPGCAFPVYDTWGRPICHLN